MNTRKQVKLAALKKEAEHYCCNFTINVQIKKQKNISFYRKKWRMTRKKYKKPKRMKLCSNYCGMRIKLFGVRFAKNLCLLILIYLLVLTCMES